MSTPLIITTRTTKVDPLKSRSPNYRSDSYVKGLYPKPPRQADIECDVHAEYEFIHFGWSIFFSKNGAFVENATGGSGEYEYSIDDGSTWYNYSHFNFPPGLNPPGTYYTKCRDKNNTENIVKTITYPLVVS